VGGTGRVPVPVGQVLYRHMVQARYLYQTCPTGTGKGQKRPVPCPRDRSYTHTGGCPCPRERLYNHAGGLSLSPDRLYTYDGACPSPTCTNLSHNVGLQSHGKFKDFYRTLGGLQPKRVRLIHSWAGTKRVVSTQLTT